MSADNTLFSSFFKNLPTAEDLAQWEDEHARMGVAIKDLTEKRQQLGELIRVAAAIHGGTEARKRGVGNANLGTSRGVIKGSWMHAVLEVASRYPEGVHYDQLRLEMPEPFASKLAQDPNAKSFYGAMRRLEEAKKAKRYKNHLFPYEAFLKHKAMVEAGEIGDVQGRDPRGSPMADELKAFLAKSPRASAKSIRAHLIEFPDFRTGLTRNSSAIYNLLKKLRDREEIVQHDDNLYSLLDGNEAPNGNPAGASVAGEVRASPEDNQPSLRLIG